MTTQVNDAAVSARETSRTTDALSTVEAASPLVFADWPATYRDELADVLFSEKRFRSAEYSQGFHTSLRARQDAFAQLQRIGHALDRVHEACRIAELAEVRTTA